MLTPRSLSVPTIILKSHSVLMLTPRSHSGSSLPSLPASIFQPYLLILHLTCSLNLATATTSLVLTSVLTVHSLPGFHSCHPDLFSHAEGRFSLRAQQHHSPPLSKTISMAPIQIKVKPQHCLPILRPHRLLPCLHLSCRHHPFIHHVSITIFLQPQCHAKSSVSFLLNFLPSFLFSFLPGLPSLQLRLLLPIPNNIE